VLWGDSTYDGAGNAMPYLQDIRIKRRLHMFHTEAFYGLRKNLTIHGLFPIEYQTIIANPFAYSDEELAELNRELNEFGIFNIDDAYDKGLGDFNMGALYALHRGDRWTSFVDVTLAFPSGKYDDIDNIIDYPIGKGTYVLSGRLATDYLLKNEITLGAYLEYGYAFDRTHLWRIPEEGSRNGILTNQKGDVNLQYGDYLKLTGNFEYVFNRNFQLSFQPAYLKKWGDNVEGYEDVYFNYFLRKRDGRLFLGDAAVIFTGTDTVAAKFMDLKVGLNWTMFGRNMDKYQQFYVTLGFFF